MDPVGLAVSGSLAYIFSTYLETSRLYVEGQQVWAEWLAWGILALTCWLWSRYGIEQTPEPSIDVEKNPQTAPSALWPISWPRKHLSSLVALLFVGGQSIALHTAQARLQWSMPLTALFVYLAVTFARFKSSPPNSLSTLTWQKYIPPTLRRRCDNNASMAIAATTFTISAFALFPYGQPVDHNLSVSGVAFAALTATAYFLVSEIPKDGISDALDHHFFSQIARQLEPIGIRVFALWTVLLALTSNPLPGSRLLIFFLAILKVVQISATLALCTVNYPVVAANVLTASAALSAGADTTAPIPNPVHLLVALAALIHGYAGLPKSRFSRALLFIIFIMPLARLLLSPESIVGHKSASLAPHPEARIGHVHPIEKLVQVNRERFDKMLAGQSKTAAQAVKEYKRRHGRSPPPGFGRWFEIAREKNFQFIDELDTVMESLEPFWGIPPSTLRARIESVQNADSTSSVTIRHEDVVETTGHYHVDNLKQWINRATWGDLIPEVNFVISTLDEPRVVAPDDTVDMTMHNILQHKENRSRKPWWTTRPVAGESGKAKMKSDDVKWINVGQQDAWEAMVSSCHIDDPARSEIPDPKPKTMFPFVQNTTTSMDVCGSADLLHHHGFLASPASLVITHSLVPIFSQCKPSIFNDVLYPSPYYQMQITSGDYNEMEDPSWEDKQDRLYWAGAGTGAYTTGENWMDVHRQRLTMMVAPDNNQSVNVLEKDGFGEWQPRATTWSDISDMFYLRITGTCQCSWESCQAQNERFGSAKEDKSAALGSKYMFDIDGNTFSGRYYRLLKSNGAVLKYTAFKEWHDGRLIPWVHYIPVSAGAEELGETMRFLLDEEEGRKIGKEIAEQGKTWARATLRVEDLEVVFIRVLMEYARLINDDRDKMMFEGG